MNKLQYNSGPQLSVVEVYSKHDALKKLMSYLNSGSYPDLSESKLNSRGYDFFESPDHPGEFILKVERHRPIAGAVYTKGQGMAAFETYSQTLVFDPVGGTLDDAGDSHVAHTIDVGALASRFLDHDFRPCVYRRENWKKKRRVVLPYDRGFLLETKSLAVACAKIEEEFRAMPHEMSFEHLENMDDETKAEYACRYEDAIVEQVLNDVIRGWEDPELLDE